MAKTFNKEQTGNTQAQPDIIHIVDYKGQKETNIIWDRTRDVVYNGDQLQMNTYSCSSCEKVYYFEQIKHSFCPFCGIKFKYETDVSV